MPTPGEPNHGESSPDTVERAGLRPVEKPDTVRRLGPVDVAALQAQVARLSDKAWSRQNAAKENDFSCFAHTRHVVFRFIPRDASLLPCFYSKPPWKLWQRWLLPVMAQAAGAYGFTAPIYPKVMLARLAAGHGIDPHIDHGGMNPLVHKIHVPLQTGPRATLTVRGGAFHLEAGYAWEVNNLETHGAFNGEERDRIHFIFEVFEGAGGEWREEWRESHRRHGLPPPKGDAPSHRPVAGSPTRSA